MSNLLTAPAIMTGIGLFFGTILAIAQRFLRVDEDPRILKDPESQVVLSALADSSVNLKLRTWVKQS